MREPDPQWSIWTTPVQGGESVEDVGVRTRRVIEKVRSAEGDAALFGHGRMLRILAACWIGLPPGAGRLLALDTAGISILSYERKTRVIKLWNRALP